MADDEPIRLGELLVKAGVLTQDKLMQRLALARQLGLPLGQILVQSHDISRENLLAAVQFQTLALENAVQPEKAVRAVQLVTKENMTLDEAMTMMGFVSIDVSHRLGEMLMAAGHLTEDDLAFALLTSAEIAVPLGHVLVQTGVVPPDVIGVALMIQKQVRMNILSPEEGIERIKVQCPVQTAKA